MENLVILYVIISYIIVCGYSVANINDDNKNLDDLKDIFIVLQNLFAPILLFYYIGKALYKIANK